MKRVSLFGATGSVGQGCVDVIAAHPDRFDVLTVTAHSDAAKLADIARKLKAKRAIIADEQHAGSLAEHLAGSGIEHAAGRDALIDAAAEDVDLHVAAIVGVAGLEPMMVALAHAKSVAVANKEPLVAAGALVMETAAKHNCRILPLDSEHNAIFQVLETHNTDAIDKIILTASGGPFREAPMDVMAKATPKEALKHPNWSMGAKISIDSATMMNKALEVIEAHFLFNMPAEKIDVVIHPQSIIHSMVAYRDGSVLAQMGAADMRTPITYCLGWPERLQTPGQTLDIQALSRMTFEAVDARRFPAIKLAYRALESGQAACIAMNAANEVAVGAFLDGRLGFLEIVETVQKMVEMTKAQAFSTLEDVLTFDRIIRTQTTDLISTLQTRKKQV